MTVQILAPEFAISGFPLRSVNSTKTRAATKPVAIRKVKRGVHFAEQLTQEYKIPSRKCRNKLSVSTEELLNRVQEMKRTVNNEYDLVDEYFYQANDLEYVNKQRRNEIPEETIKVLALEDAIQKLKGRREFLERETSNMKLSILRIKSKSSPSRSL